MTVVVRQPCYFFFQTVIWRSRRNENFVNKKMRRWYDSDRFEPFENFGTEYKNIL